jgi:NitT/TauT family transport system substrate-binding protein
MKFARFFAGAAIALTAALLSMPASTEPIKIRIAWATAPGHITPLIPKVPMNVYRHYGKSYVVEPVFIAGSGPSLQALAVGEIELGGLSPQSVVLGLAEAKVPLKAIAQLLSSDMPGYGANGFWVRTDAGINKVEDLKGKKIGVNARGSSIDAAVRTMLTRHGLKDGDDYQIVEMRFPAQLAALESKRIDMGILLQPFNYAAEKKGGFKQLFTMGDALGPAETLSYVGKADWIDKNRAAIVDFLEDHMLMRRWLVDPKTRMDAVKVLAEVTKQPVANYTDWAFTQKDTGYRAPDLLIDPARFQKNVDDLKNIGVLPMSIPVAPHIDLSLAKAAAARVTTN